MDGQNGLEKSLAKTESDAEITLKAATVVVNSLKRVRVAAQVGNLRELRKAIEVSEQAIVILRQQFANTKEGWDFNEDSYLSSSAYSAEILQLAKQMSVKIFEQDDRLYCYPFLIRILPNECSILIDKTREKRLRPSVLVNHLKSLQNKPVRFKPETFLESLFSAYTLVSTDRENHLFRVGAVVKLIEIYRVLTLLPGQYSLQEFARDIYLLDQSGIVRTKKGFVVSFPASTGTKSASNTITVITKDGQEKKYYGIAFTSE